jgi:hypothetical protein
MYVRVLQDELQFPEDRTMDQDTKSLLRGVRVARSLSLRVGGVSWHSRLFFGSAAFAAQSLTSHVRASHQETSLFLNDVRFVRRRSSDRLADVLYRDWSHVYYKRYIRECIETPSTEST